MSGVCMGLCQRMCEFCNIAHCLVAPLKITGKITKITATSTDVPAGTTVENKGKLILTEIFPSVQKHDIF